MDILTDSYHVLPLLEQPPSALAVPSTLFDTAPHTHCGAARSNSFASVAPEPSVNSNLLPYLFHPPPLDVMHDLIQDTAKVHRQGPPHPTSVATLVDKFEQSLTFVIPSSATEPESTAPFEQGRGQQPSLFERETAEPLEQDKDRIPACFLDLEDPVSLSTYAFPQPHTSPRVAPLACPRPPTPPPSRRPSKPIRHRTDTTYYRTHTTKTDLVELPVAQASVRVPSRRKTALDLMLRAPAVARCSRRRRKVDVEEEEELRRPERRARIRQTRFVVPDPEDEGEENGVASHGARPRWTRANDGMKQTNGSGPLRSILRNKPAMPYDKTMVRHAGRRASVP